LLSIIFIVVIISTVAYLRLKSIQTKNTLKQRIIEAEQFALRAQMNPHFVFNALNSIQRFILCDDSEMAGKYLTIFGSLVRRIFENSKYSFIPIIEEIATLELYLEIEGLRFANTFRYNIVLDESIDEYNFEVPPMIIQPYVENAIWHGLLHKKTGGDLKIEFKKGDDIVICIIEDNGIGRKKSSIIKQSLHNEVHTSSGMDITEKRLINLSHLTNKKYSVKIIDLYDGTEALGTRVEIQFSDL
jgi:LytS/YehU family sensor histidine kinase